MYFLSKDLLSKNGLLTKGGEANSGRVFWDILDRTIRDPERNLYLFIDEAHRGLGANASSERGTATIYANLIDGLDDREKRIIRLRFFEGRTQMEVAREIHISQAQVSRLEKGALAHIRDGLA